MDIKGYNEAMSAIYWNGHRQMGDQCAWCTRPAKHWYDYEGTREAVRICFECGCCGDPRQSKGTR